MLLLNCPCQHFLCQPPPPQFHKGIFRNLIPQHKALTLLNKRMFHIPCSLLAVSVSKGLAVALDVIWVIRHLNLNKHKGKLPVLLHFHFSRDSIARAGAKNAKALAWNKGNLVERERRDTDVSRRYGPVSGYQLQLGVTHPQNHPLLGVLTNVMYESFLLKRTATEMRS